MLADRKGSGRVTNLAIASAASAAAVLAPLTAVGFDLRLFTRDATAASARTQLWLTLVAVEAAAWVLIVAWIAGILARLYHMGAAPAREVATQALLPVLVLGTPAVLLTYAGRASSSVPPRNVGEFSIRNMTFIGGTGVLVAAACVFAMFWARLALRGALAKGDLGHRILSHLELHTDVRTSLLFSSVTLALGTLAAAALRAAANASAQLNVFPAEYVIAYGLGNSVYLAIAYFPVQWQFLKYGRELALEYAGEPGPTPDSLAQWYAKMSQAQEMLGTGWADLRGVTGALVALGPAMMGLISHLLSIR